MPSVASAVEWEVAVGRPICTGFKPKSHGIEAYWLYMSPTFGMVPIVEFCHDGGNALESSARDDDDRVIVLISL